jgi:hypothetical protein
MRRKMEVWKESVYAAPSFNHLLFADDSLVLIKATSESARTLQNVLQLYEMCSGQTINFDKSSVMFSENTSNARRNQVLGELHIRAEARTEKYLGLPIYVGRSKSKVFAYLKDRVWKKIQGWKEKMLSKAGKDILIKACAQAIPAFAMSCFDLTKTLCEEISTMICRYWWAQQENENKIHWLSWEKLTKPKSEGGLGFRDLYGFNMAMLSRQAWRLLDNPNSLCGRVLKARYFPTSSILEATAAPGISYTWRSILKGVSLLKEGLVWRIGDGKNIRIWRDNWLPRNFALKPQQGKTRCRYRRVEQLVDNISGTWNHDLVQKLFYQQDADTILQLNAPEKHGTDSVAWQYESNGLFSVKSAYKLAYSLKNNTQSKPGSSTTGDNNITLWNLIWKAPVPNKIKKFGWRTACDNLATKKTN